MRKSSAHTRPERPRFRDTALASGLLDADRLTGIEEELAASIDPLAMEPEAWDRAMADRAVGKGMLTPFQAREMLAGRRRFRLGQYTVLDEVARGGMGQVFRAEHAMMGREVAVKVLPRSKSTPESEAAFRREMRMLGRLDHENLVRAFDAGYDAMVYYLVTELVPGVDLKRYVKQYGPLDESAAASVIVQAARGLAYAHEQGLVHRDVKPGNILVLDDGRVKVLDLGLAGSQLEEESVRLGRVVGTMDYIAPEQVRSPDDVTPAADIYSLGCTFYYAVSGRVPFPGGSRREKMHRHLYDAPEPIRHLVPHLSDGVCRVIEEMMAKEPARRPPTAAAVVAQLTPWLPTGGLLPQRPPSPRDASATLADHASASALPPPLPGRWWSGERPSAESWGHDDRSSLSGTGWGVRSSGGVMSPGGAGLAKRIVSSVTIAAVAAVAAGLAVSLARRVEHPPWMDGIVVNVTAFQIAVTLFVVLTVVLVAVGASALGRR